MAESGGESLGMRMPCGGPVNWSKFGLNHDQPSDFTSSQWQRRKTKLQWPYAVYRLLMFGFVFGNYVANMTNYVDKYFLIYLTNQGITLLLTSEILNMSVVIREVVIQKWKKSQHLQRNEIPLLTKVFWAFNTVASCLALLITIIYWGALYGEGKPAYFDAFVHALNSVIVVVDLLVSARPWRLHHFYLPLSYGICYMTFTIVYHFAGGTDPSGNPYIYDIIDWRDPGPTVGYVVLCAVVLFASHAFLCGIALARAYMQTRLCCIDSVGETTGLVTSNASSVASIDGQKSASSAVYTIGQEADASRTAL